MRNPTATLINVKRGKTIFICCVSGKELADEEADKGTNSEDIYLFQIFSDKMQKKLMEIAGAAVRARAQMAEMAVKMVPFIERFNKQMAETVAKMAPIMAEIAVNIIKIMAQYRAAIQNGITNFNGPEDYDISDVSIHPLTLGFSINQGREMLDDIKNSHFDYLSDRYCEGFEAYISGDYQKAIFTFLSCLDGILKEFCISKNYPYSGNFPTFEDSRTHFMSYYKWGFAADNAQFQDRLKAFFDHRNQIMHGDRHAYFDENIATISLLFLGLVFYTVENEI